ncbi:hypothetical protein [Corynebacterium aquilae]|uniref:hypothetical protein n=1 Tax=Corynebacterium aquilae TaxID=203263 RepID=UPI0012ED69DF|nr:hypothetical protein [Corynebacterium aquilae]
MDTTTDSTPTPDEVAAKTTDSAPAGTRGDKPQMSVEDYQRELENVRREAAKYRAGRN